MTPKLFLDQLTSLRFDNVFNPYVDRCEVHDLSDAPFRRSKVLLSILNTASFSGVEAIWIGRDLGYRGGRRTGLALTDDVHSAKYVTRWGQEYLRPTHGELFKERTAAVIWDVLDRLDEKIFLWNVFPLHPHELNSPFTNRGHSAVERRVGEELLASLVQMLRPKRIIAIGNDAKNSADKLGIKAPIYKVRHPSYGGQNEFLASIKELYRLTELNGDPQNPLDFSGSG